MQPKQGVFDRIEQSVELFKNNFKNIFLSYFLYKFGVFIVGSFIYYIALNIIDFDSILGNKSEGLNSIGELFGNTGFLIGINIFIILILVNIILIIPFILAVIKTIKESYEEKQDINYIENIKYGFKNLYNSFRTYWYIFAYVALIPFIVLIIGGLLVIFGQYNDIKNILEIGVKISGFGLFLLVLFSVYRGIKSTFGLYSAIDEDEYTKENFDKSIEITNNNWWRMVGNFLLVGILISIIGGIINGIIGIVEISSSGILDLLNLNDLNSIQNGTFNSERIGDLIKQYTGEIGTFSLFGFLVDILKLIIENIFTIFMFIFTYIFYERLKLESNDTLEITEEKNYQN